MIFNTFKMYVNSTFFKTQWHLVKLLIMWIWKKKKVKKSKWKEKDFKNHLCEKNNIVLL